MIAAVRRWHAVFAALLFSIPPGAAGAEDLNGAARELARKTAAFAGRGEAVAVTWRNLSSLGAPELGQVRTAFEAALKDAGGRLGEQAPAAEARITLSENQSQYLLAAEVRKGDDKQVWIAAWNRTEPAMAVRPGIALEKRLVWEQDEQILDVAFPAAGLLVLSPTRLTLYARQNGAWERQQALPLTPSKPWPRDLHGHLQLNAAAFRAFLPGLTCSGTTAPSLTLECHAVDEPWVLESGSRALLLATFAAARNYFDGRVVTQTGLRKTLPPFFSAASVEELGRPLWLLAMVDGSTQIFTAALDTLGSVSAWGSDIAGIDARCGGGFQVLATRPGDGTEPDAVQAFAIVDRAPIPLTAPVVFPGPVTALWTSGGISAVAISRDPATGKYAAYILSLVCGA